MPKRVSGQSRSKIPVPESICENATDSNSGEPKSNKAKRHTVQQFQKSLSDGNLFKKGVKPISRTGSLKKRSSICGISEVGIVQTAEPFDVKDVCKNVTLILDDLQDEFGHESDYEYTTLEQRCEKLENTTVEILDIICGRGDSKSI